MAQIYELSSADQLSLADLIPLFIVEDQDTRKATLSAVLDLLVANITVGKLTTQYFAPSGFTVSTTVTADTHLIYTPVNTGTALTVTLPASPTDRAEFLMNSTQAVTTLTIDGNGKTVTGAPTSLLANGFFRLKYDGVMGVWYRVA